MKFYLKPLLFAGAFVALLTYSGCGPDNPPDPSVEEVQLGKLKGTWTVTGSNGTDVKLDGVSKIANYTGFSITLDGTVGASSFGYTTTGRPTASAWPASGTWTFGTEPSTQVIRDPATENLNITYALTDTQLQLTFTYAGDPISRTSNVKGQWVFTLAKQ